MMYVHRFGLNVYVSTFSLITYMNVLIHIYIYTHVHMYMYIFNDPTLYAQMHAIAQ